MEKVKEFERALNVLNMVLIAISVVTALLVLISGLSSKDYYNNISTIGLFIAFIGTPLVYIVMHYTRIFILGIAFTLVQIAKNTEKNDPHIYATPSSSTHTLSQPDSQITLSNDIEKENIEMDSENSSTPYCVICGVEVDRNNITWTEKGESCADCALLL